MLCSVLTQLALMATQKQESILKRLEAKQPTTTDVAKSHEAKNSLLKQRLMYEEVLSVQ